MTKLLILPGNKAIRINPENPDGFPDFHHQVLVPGVQAALDFYKQEGFTIAICENAASIASRITPLNEKLSEFIRLMSDLAPQVDQLMFCPDYGGAFAYLLSKSDNSFPKLRRLHAHRVLTSDRPPDDESESWEDAQVKAFRKPESGMLDFMVLSHTPSHVVAVWERPEDKEAIAMMSPGAATLYVQSATFWRESLNPTGSDLKPSQAIQKKRLQAPCKTRRFEYKNAAQNSSKFWEITILSDGLGFDINYGRIGTNGRSTPIRKIFTTTSEAQQDYQKRIGDQLRDGYVEV